ncbi:unnamed protein product [Arabidopsis halleri]
MLIVIYLMITSLIMLFMVKENFIVDSECHKGYFYTLLMLLNNMTTTSINDAIDKSVFYLF